MLSATAQWFVWIKLEWAINSTSQGQGGGYIRKPEREIQPKKMQRLAKAAKTSLVSRARH